jgi:integrase
MREAVDARLINESPCRRVTLPRIEHQERRFLTAEEVETLAASLIAQAQVREAIRPDRRSRQEPDPYSVLVYVGCYLGLRWGELAGLKRSHVHLLKRQLRVVGSLERLKGGFRYVEETKTVNSRRTIPIPAFLAEMLALHLAAADVGVRLLHGARHLRQLQELPQALLAPSRRVRGA